MNEEQPDQAAPLSDDDLPDQTPPEGFEPQQEIPEDAARGFYETPPELIAAAEDEIDTITNDADGAADDGDDDAEDTED